MVEHLSEILNRHDPTNPVGEHEETGELEQIEEIDGNEGR